MKRSSRRKRYKSICKKRGRKRYGERERNSGVNERDVKFGSNNGNIRPFNKV